MKKIDALLKENKIILKTWRIHTIKHAHSLYRYLFQVPAIRLADVSQRDSRCEALLLVDEYTTLIAFVIVTISKDRKASVFQAFECASAELQNKCSWLKDYTCKVQFSCKYSYCLPIDPAYYAYLLVLKIYL